MPSSKQWLVAFTFFVLFSVEAGTASLNSTTHNLEEPSPVPQKAKPGDMIIVSFGSDGIPAPWKQIVKVDGRIDLPLKKSVVANGKTADQLEKDIEAVYVPEVVKRLTVLVRFEATSEH